MYGGRSSGHKGNRNALKHGRYTAEAVAGRREMAALVRKMMKIADLSWREATWIRLRLGWSAGGAWQPRVERTAGAP
jgi:hypothetical protein